VKKECDKLLAEKKESGSSSATTGSGSLRHLTEEAFEDAVMDDSVIDSVDIASNDTSNDILAYFSRMSNHYLQLAKASPHLPRHPMKYPIIADSGVFLLFNLLAVLSYWGMASLLSILKVLVL
jgi:hypothetical protein